MRPRLGTLRRFALAPMLVAALSAGAGCEDERDPTGSTVSSLDADAFWSVAVVSTLIYRYHNTVVEDLLDIIESGAQTPIIRAPCDGTGSLVIAEIGCDEIPGSTLPAQCPPPLADETRCFMLRYARFRIDCTELPLQLDGTMFVSFVETDPGLHYRIRQPYNWETGVPEGVRYTLPEKAGGFTLLASTPGQLDFTFCTTYGVDAYIDCILDEGSTRHAGNVHQFGSFKFENPSGGITFVQENDLEYKFDEAVDPAFAQWPAGLYELSAFQFGFFGGSTSDFPTDVNFDGQGGASFQYQGRTCTMDLNQFNGASNEPFDEFSGNSCAGL